MDIVRLLTGRKEKPFDLQRIDASLGPWRPFKGPDRDCIPGTRLPRKLRWKQKKFFFRSKEMEQDFAIGVFTHWLRIRPRLLRFVAYFMRDSEKYKRREIPRAGKTPRIIEEPIPVLKFIQRRILKRILEQTGLPDYAHGFVSGRSIATAASPHTNKEVVVCCDLRDFFPTITIKRVWGIFRILVVNPRAANLLAELTTYKKRLPQGAPTSPMLANLVVRHLDHRLAGLSRTMDITYTRYADDMIFSGGPETPRILKMLREIVKEEGFTLAEEKTRILRRGRRQEVCGLVVNDSLGIPRRWRRNLRAQIHNIAKAGAIKPENISSIQGKLGFLQHFHPEESLKLKEKLLSALDKDN